MESSPRMHLDGMLSPTSATRRSVGHSTETSSQRSGEQQFGGGATDFGVHTPSSKHSPWNNTKTPTNGSVYRTGSISSRGPPTQPSTPSSTGGFGFTTDDTSKSTESQASMQLLNAVMGAGIVGYPFCFKSCGLLLATLLVLVTVLAAEFSMQLLLYAAHLAGKRSYEEIARHSFGPLGQGLVDFSISIINLGSLVAYLNLASDTFSLVAGTIVPPGAEPSRTAILSGITVCIALPLCIFVKSPRVLASVSQASVAFLLLFAGVLLVLGVVGSTASSFNSLQWWNWNGVLTAFPVIAYSFTAHQVLFAVYVGMNKPTVQKMTGVVTKTMSAAATVYIAVGIAGYKAFGYRTHGDVLRNLGGGNGTIAEHLIKVGYGLSLIATLPLIILPLQTTFAPAVNRLLRLIQKGDGRDTKISSSSSSTTSYSALNASSPLLAKPFGQLDTNKDLREGLVTAGVLGIACTIATLVPNVEYVFGLAGSTASVLISFVFPAALFLQASGMQRGQQGYSVDLARNSPKWRQRRHAAAVLLIFGLIAGVACTGALLTSIKEEAEVVSLAQEIAKEEKKASDAVATKEEAASVAHAVGVVDEARRRFDATKEGLDETLLVVERAENANAAAAAAAASDTKTGKGKKSSASNTQQVINAQKASQKAAAKDLKPALAVAEQAVAELESTAASLEAALSRKKSSSLSSNDSGRDDDENPNNPDTRLERLRAAGLEALQAVRESRLALADAHQTLKMRKGSGGGGNTDAADTLETVLHRVIAASTAASKKVDETMAALTAAEEEQKEEVAELVVKLSEQRKKESGTAAAVVGGMDTNNTNSNKRSNPSSTSPNPPGGKKNEDQVDDKQKNDLSKTGDGDLEATTETLEEDLHAGREVNATKLAQAAADAAEDIVQTAKEAAEQAVGKAKKVDVAVRAIEIAKELAGNIKSNSGSRDGNTLGNKEDGSVRDMERVVEDINGVASNSGGAQNKEALVIDDDDDKINGADLLLGNLTAVAEAISGRMDDEALVTEVSAGRKSSRKMDFAG